MGDDVWVSFHGERTGVGAGSTVGAFVDARVGERRGIAVAVNDEVVPRSEWDSTGFADGDRVDVVRAVQGG